MIYTSGWIECSCGNEMLLMHEVMVKRCMECQIVDYNEMEVVD